MNGIRITYRELLSVAIELPFYANGQKSSSLSSVPDISIAPDTATLELFKRMDLVMRTTESGCIILARVQDQTPGGDDILRFPAPKGSKITLLLRLNNRELMNMYDLPVTMDTSKLLYLRNTVSDGGALRTDLHVSTAAAGISGNSDQIAYAKATYRFHDGMPVDPETATVKHPVSGAEILSKSCINSATGTDLLFDLSTLPSGRCELWIDGLKKDTFYHLVDNNNPQPVFGVVELSLDAALDANYRVIEADRSITSQRPRYVVRFVSRKTFWRYTFRLLPTSPLAIEISALSTAGKAAFLAQLNILTNDATITFAPDPSSTEQQLVFVSGSKLALQDAYHTSTGSALSLDLTKNTGDIALKAYVKRWLPLPASGMINATALPNVYSDIFITI